MTYRVKNWRSFQHYKDRNPPWIKLHFALLSSSDWVMLDDQSRVLAIACMLIASRNEGVIPDNPAYIQRVAYLRKPPNFKPLIECGFLECDSDSKQMLADARPEERRDREEERRAPTKLNGHGKRTPVPDAFEITEPMWSWAREQGVPQARVEPETAKFLDHHKAKGSAFLDWPAAWRTWMRKSVEFAARAH